MTEKSEKEKNRMRSVKVRIAKEADCELSFEIVAPAIPKKSKFFDLVVTYAKSPFSV